MCDGTGSRSARFLAQLNGEKPASFADIANPSALRRTVHDTPKEMGLVAGCLYHRPTIDRVVEGAPLARLAEAVGMARFDSICDSDLTGFDLAPAAQALPDTPALQAAGLALLARADGCPSACRLAERAADIVMATDRNTS